MDKRAGGKRREAKPAEPGGAWIAVMCELLKGALAAVAAAVLTLLACSLLVGAGALPEGAMDRAALAAGVLGGLVGGLTAALRLRRSTLLVGIGVGAILFLLLLSAGALVSDSVSLANGGAPVLLSCLCGGAMAGILGARPRKKRKR